MRSDSTDLGSPPTCWISCCNIFKFTPLCSPEQRAMARVTHITPAFWHRSVQTSCVLGLYFALGHLLSNFCNFSTGQLCPTRVSRLSPQDTYCPKFLLQCSHRTPFVHLSHRFKHRTSLSMSRGFLFRTWTLCPLRVGYSGTGLCTY